MTNPELSAGKHYEIDVNGTLMIGDTPLGIPESIDIALSPDTDPLVARDCLLRLANHTAHSASKVVERYRDWKELPFAREVMQVAVRRKVVGVTELHVADPNDAMISAALLAHMRASDHRAVGSVLSKLDSLLTERNGEPFEGMMEMIEIALEKMRPKRMIIFLKKHFPDEAWARDIIYDRLLIPFLEQKNHQDVVRVLQHPSYQAFFDKDKLRRAIESCDVADDKKALFMQKAGLSDPLDDVDAMMRGKLK